ncbi:MAG: DUF4340 domain-containing protein [Coraliomargarita sp.]
MRFKFTLFLLVLNAVTFGLIYFLSNQDERSSSQPRGLSSAIGREVIEADRISIRGPELKTPRVLVREGSNWSIEKPLAWPANYFAVNRILNQLQFLEEQAAFSLDEINRTGQSLSDYGLDQPSLILEISNPSNSIELKIGSRTEIGQNVYVLGPKGDHIYVVSSEVIDSLLIELPDLRTREIFDIPVFEVDALSVQTRGTGDVGELKVHLRRTNKGWLFEAPLSAEADPTLVSNTINSLTAVKVERFIPQSGDPLIQGLEAPSMQVTLNGNKRYQTLIIGNPDPDGGENPTYYAKLENNPTVFTVDAQPFDQLREAQQSLRERSFMNFESGALSAINLSGGDLEIRLHKLETGGWQSIRGGQDEDVKPHRASQEIMGHLIHDLANLRATGFAVDAPTPADLDRLGFSAPRRTITLSFKDDAPELILELAHPSDDNENLYARTNRSEYIYQVDRRAALLVFPLNELHYRKRTLESLPQAATIAAIRLENILTNTTILEITPAGEGRTWEDYLNESTEAERDALSTILQWIRKFRVSSYLAPHYAEVYTLGDKKELPWAYRLSADIILPGGSTDKEVTHSYVFTERLSGSAQPGGSALHDAIFETSPDLIEAIHVFASDFTLPPEVTGDDVATPQALPLLPTPDEALEAQSATPAPDNTDADTNAPATAPAAQTPVEQP